MNNISSKYSVSPGPSAFHASHHLISTRAGGMAIRSISLPLFVERTPTQSSIIIPFGSGFHSCVEKLGISSFSTSHGQASLLSDAPCAQTCRPYPSGRTGKSSLSRLETRLTSHFSPCARRPWKGQSVLQPSDMSKAANALLSLPSVVKVSTAGHHTSRGMPWWLP